MQLRAPAIVALLAVVAVALGAAGCSSSDTPRSDGPSTTGDGPKPPPGDGPQLPADTKPPPTKNLNSSAPASPVRLVFIHHSVGEDLGKPDGGDLRAALNKNRYYVVDTNYEWGPADQDAGEAKIGDHTDVGHWWSWFLGPHRDTYLNALYTTSHVTDAWAQNEIGDPGGQNTVVLFKSCFLAGMRFSGSPNDAPLAEGTPNPIHGKGVSDDSAYTVANAKGLYRDLLKYFATRQDRLFVLLTTPPAHKGEMDAAQGAALRGINLWLVRKWLAGYPHSNVAVFDFHNVLTSNGGSPAQSDLGAAAGAHHRLGQGYVEHKPGASDFLAYESPGPDSHPTPAGLKKAAAELVPLLNVAYHCWKKSGDCPTLMGRE